MSGHKRVYVLFYLAGLAMVALAGWAQHSPGYMDADYYFSGGKLLAEGGGLRMPLLWNYLDAPQGLPSPGYSYWMPLAALFAGAGAMLGGGFLTARLPFWLLAAVVPPLTVSLGLLLHGDRRKALLGGCFALFPAYYLAYLPTTDVFGMYMLLAGGLILLVQKGGQSPACWLACGVLAGMMHLARAEGIFWLAGILVLAAWPVIGSVVHRKTPRGETWLTAGVGVMAVIAGYLLPMSFWYARNLQTWGWLFPPGNGRTLWLTRYEDTFLYPASVLTPQRWLASGAQAILAARWEALLANVQTWIAVQGEIVLFPFALGGLWRLRGARGVRFGAGMWLAVFLSMSVVFPFAGINGAFFHSGAALQPLMWAAAPLGIEAGVGWLAQKRRWQQGGRVRRFVEGLLMASGIILSLLLTVQRVNGEGGPGESWNRSHQHYRAVEARLVELGATPCLVVMVNNPPGYYAATERPGVVIPFGDEAMVTQAVRQYGVSYLILEENDAGHLRRLFEKPGDGNGLRYLGDVEGTKLYAFTNQE